MPPEWKQNQKNSVTTADPLYNSHLVGEMTCCCRKVAVGGSNKSKDWRKVRTTNADRCRGYRYGKVAVREAN